MRKTAQVEVGGLPPLGMPALDNVIMVSQASALYRLHDNRTKSALCLTPFRGTAQPFGGVVTVHKFAEPLAGIEGGARQAEMGKKGGVGLLDVPLAIENDDHERQKIDHVPKHNASPLCADSLWPHFIQTLIIHKERMRRPSGKLGFAIRPRLR